MPPRCARAASKPFGIRFPDSPSQPPPSARMRSTLALIGRLAPAQVYACSHRANLSIRGSVGASTGIEPTPGRFCRASSVNVCPGGISRNSLQPSSLRTVVASCQRTPWAMLLTRTSAIRSLVRNARALTFPTWVNRGLVRLIAAIRFAKTSATGLSKGQWDNTETCSRTALAAPCRPASAKTASIAVAAH
jgi:hypothetical protein